MFRLSSFVKVWLGAMLLLGYLCIVLYSPVHMIHMAETNTPMEHCPFSMSTHIICTMTLADHMRIWQSWMYNFSISYEFALAAAVFFTGLYVIFTHGEILRFLLYKKRHGTIKLFLLLQNLFSQGLLHTKAY